MPNIIMKSIPSEENIAGRCIDAAEKDG